MVKNQIPPTGANRESFRQGEFLNGGRNWTYISKLKQLIPHEKYADLALLLSMLEINFLTLGLIVAASLSVNLPLQKSAIIACVQASASLFGIVISRRQKLARLLCRRIFSSTAMSLMLFTTSFSILWTMSLFVTLLSLTRRNAEVAAAYPEKTKNSKAAPSKLQLISVISVGISMSIGPLIADRWGINCVTGLVFILNIAGLFSRRSLNPTGSLNSSPSEMVPSRLKQTPKVLLLVNFVTWTAMGLFNVIELPMLRERFGATALLMSIIFLITLTSNFLVARLGRAFALKNSHFILIITAMFLTATSIIYLVNYNLLLVFIIVSFFGGLNALYNLAQFTEIYHLKDFRERTNLILSLKVAMYLGVLLSAAVLVLLNFYPSHINQNLIFFLSTLFGFLTLACWKIEKLS